MKTRIVSDANVKLMPAHEKLFAYAYGYINAARSLCERAISLDEKCEWTDGVVVMMNAVQAVELFLKAMLLKVEPEGEISQTHDIDQLAIKYEATYPGAVFQWEIPFRKPKPAGLTPEQAAYLKARSAPASIELRYPLSKEGLDWFAHQGFEPVSFAHTLRVMHADFDRVSNM